MGTISILAFQGLGFRDYEPYTEYKPLIYSGHVGMAFEGYPKSIIGFRPTDEEILQQGGLFQTFMHLQSHNPPFLKGALYNDYDSFLEAYTLAQNPPDPLRRTDVYQYTLQFAESEFERIRQQVYEWYTHPDNYEFLYDFPVDPKPVNRDNCATFTYKLGMPVFYPNGQLKLYLINLKAAGGTLWKPEA